MSGERERDRSERMPPNSVPPMSAHLTPVADLDHLQYSETDAVALLTINRPAVHNAISLATMDELDRVFNWLETGSQAGVLVLTAAGTRAFVSGGDLKDFEQLNTYESAAAMSRRMQVLMARMHQLPLPVIGAINGDCIGGGCEVALATDIRIVSATAHFGFKQVSLGITPAWGGRRRLIRLVGRSTALTLLLSGNLIDAAEAYRIGLADRVVPPAEILPAALELAGEIAQNPRMAVRAIKRAVNRDDAVGAEDDIAFEADLFGRAWMSHDHQEALVARKEKRAPNFRGR